MGAPDAASAGPQVKDRTRRNSAAVLLKPGVLRIQPRPIPVADPDEVVLRVEAVGVCGSDVHYYKEGRIGDFVVEAPMILGHETCGVVVEVGSSVSHLAQGDLVAVEPGVPCGRCAECRSGRYNLCPEMSFHATPPTDGTMQLFVAVNAEFAHRLPAGFDAETGALVEPTAVAVWACRRAGISVESRVLVTGAGPIGLLTMQVARAFGAKVVDITDIDPQKVDIARTLGADKALPADAIPSAGSLYDVHVECSGSQFAAEHGIATLGPRGTSVIVGGGAQAIRLPTGVIRRRELTITGVFRYAGCFPTAIDLLRTGRVRVGPLISGRYPLEAAERAILAAGRPGVLRTLIRPQLRELQPASTASSGSDPVSRNPRSKSDAGAGSDLPVESVVKTRSGQTRQGKRE